MVQVVVGGWRSERCGRGMGDGCGKVALGHAAQSTVHTHDRAKEPRARRVEVSDGVGLWLRAGGRGASWGTCWGAGAGAHRPQAGVGALVRHGR